MELLIPLVYDKIFSEKYLEKQFKNEISDYDWVKNLNSDTLLLLAGSSSVKYSLSCSILDSLSGDNSKYVNIAHDARDPMATYFILKNLNLKRVTTLYLGLDPWIYAKRYYKYRGNWIYLDFTTKEAIKFTFEHDFNTFFTRFKQLCYYFFNVDAPTCVKNSIVPADFGSKTLDEIPLNFEEKPYEMFQIESYGWSKLQFIYLKKIIHLCDKNGIQLSFFIPPKRSDFIRLYKVECSQIHQDYVQNLIKNNINTPIFGKYDQLLHEGDSLNFVDQFHLNKRGQKRYSEIFYQLTQSSLPSKQNQYYWFTH